MGAVPLFVQYCAPRNARREQRLPRSASQQGTVERRAVTNSRKARIFHKRHNGTRPFDGRPAASRIARAALDIIFSTAPATTRFNWWLLVRLACPGLGWRILPFFCPHALRTAAMAVVAGG
jgi:hypothetical protein